MKKQNINCILFDFDGVLIDSLPTMEIAWKSVQNKFGILNTFLDYRKHIGLPFKEILSHIFMSLKKKERFFYMPSFLAILQGKILEKLPKPLFTYDQYVTLSHDSISEGSQKLVTDILKQDLSNMKIITSEYLKKFIDRV